MSDSKTTVIVPTAINVVTMVNNNILQNRKLGFDATIELPSRRDLARAVVTETGVIPVSSS